MSVFTLISIEVIDFIVLLTTENEISSLYLHVVKYTVDLHKRWLIVWTSLNQTFSEKLTSFIVGAISNVAFPKSKNLTD